MNRAVCGFIVTLTAFGQNLSFPPDEDPRYFPTHVFAQGRSDGDFEARWYASRLRALREPSLLDLPTAAVVYRFIWLRTFHRPIGVRVVFHGTESATVFSKMTNGTGGYSPGLLTKTSTCEIKARDLQRLQELIDHIDFWNEPTYPPPTDAVIGLDGAQWILEAWDHGRYHVISRWSPRDGPLRELGLYLTRNVSRFNIPENEIY